MDCHNRSRFSSLRGCRGTRRSPSCCPFHFFASPVDTILLFPFPTFLWPFYTPLVIHDKQDTPSCNPFPPFSILIHRRICLQDRFFLPTYPMLMSTFQFPKSCLELLAYWSSPRNLLAHWWQGNLVGYIFFRSHNEQWCPRAGYYHR